MSPSNPWQFLRSFGHSWGSLVSGVLSIPFTFLALHADDEQIKTIWIVLALGAALFAAYFVWKEERDKVCVLQDELTPKLCLQFNPFLIGCLHPAKTKELPAGRELMCIRVLVTSSARVIDCVGYLVRVHKMDRGIWVRDTTYAASIPLNWADIGPIPLTIHPGTNNFLECLYVRKLDNKAEIAASNPPEMNKDMFNSGDKFKLEIVVSGNVGGERSILFGFQLGDKWDKPNVWELS